MLLFAPILPTPPNCRMALRCSRHIVACLLLLAAPAWASAQSRWPDEREAGPFRCHADFSLAGQEPLLEELSLLQKDLTAILTARESREADRSSQRLGVGDHAAVRGDLAEADRPSLDDA